MRYIKIFLIGIFFGIVLIKSEAVSWYRIQEMFLFDSFHMYGIIGSAVGLGVLLMLAIKKLHAKSFSGKAIILEAKEKGWKRYIYGGTIFGLGWALTGACPGPVYALIGNGATVFVVVLLSAVFGAFVYGAVRSKLPH
ncbi:DUF6691 family protein [Flammeovirgaceae bacterium SG7u.111]|nr:DUF6691 family protein [Flammeovirgaceae bacterium SG7u.132]WPO36629.1 DUF6691 family protein [Flammeovirgaceae bacterium SG7u.111]